MGIISFTKKILFGVYKQVFKNKISVKELEKENETLKYQLEYMKRHFDIRQMKPAIGWLREFQLKEIEFAKEIISLFKGIDFFLESGGLIGAIRHGGFIPYDDDIDLDVVRKDFRTIIDYSQKHFVWIDTTDIYENFMEFQNNAIKNNPNKIVAILTPFCLHLYKGTSLRDSLNVEIFPYDYIKEDVLKEDFAKYVQNSISAISKMKSWKEIFDYYDLELSSDKIFSDEKTSKIVPGLGHGTFFHQKFVDFQSAKDIFPIKYVKFENTTLPVPAEPEKVIEKIYPNWRSFPSDVGISKDLKVLNDYLITIGECIPWMGC